MKPTTILAAFFLILTGTVSAKHIVINLSQQRACAYEGNSPAFCGNISTGKPGHRTPSGHFRVLEKDIDHVSTKYPEPNGGAKMHYMLRLTGSGIAMHLGYVPSYPASHGCIRLQNGFAQRMYRWAHVGTPVRIIGSPPAHVNRSAFSSTYATRRVSRTRRVYRANATDILAEFMGRPARKSIRKSRTRHRSARKHRAAKRRHTARHRNPLHALAAR